MRSFLLPTLLLMTGLMSPQVAIGQQTGTQTGTPDSTDTGSTTESASRRTTDGVTGGDSTAEASDTFVGGSNSEDFVGGSQRSQNNSAANRFFRSITGQEVPTGRTSEASGEPRRVPTQLRLGFRRPTPRDAAILAGRGGIDLVRFRGNRPDLQSVVARMDDTGNVVLNGNVTDPASSRLAANLLRMQPGVRKVTNQVQVIEPPLLPDN